jgi:Aminoglycoside-2''-adenylyltransferase
VPIGRWDDAEWRPWHPAEVARRLRDVQAPWYVAAGYAIDLFVGRDRREHEDVEIGVPAERFAEVAEALSDLDFYTPAPGAMTPVAGSAERLAETHQTWGLERAAGVWRIDVFREPSVDGRWVCRRDERIRLPYDDLIEHTAERIPYLRPEVVLLFKAKQARPKDESDLAAVLPLLPAPRRRLLAEWLELVHPGHFWLPDLA